MNVHFLCTLSKSSQRNREMESENKRRVGLQKARSGGKLSWEKHLQGSILKKSQE